MELPKVLITGISGFVGSHLAEAYEADGWEVYGLIRRRSTRENLKHLKSTIFVEGDINDPHRMDEVIKTIKPKVIHHLAAQSFVPTSWTEPQETLRINLFGSLHIFEAVKKHHPETVIHLASTSEVYGAQEIIPIKETNIPRPLSPYAVSKLAMENLGSQYVASYGLRIVITRSFNHTGPRRHEHFVESSFAKQFAEGKHVLEVGNLDAVRDFTDVRDMVRAYKCAVHLTPGVPFNICSERGIYIFDIIEILKAISFHQPLIHVNELLKRPSDIPTLIGDCSKFKSETGWSPTIPFEDTLKDLYDYWKSSKN